MHWPQFVWIVLTAMTLGVAGAKNGEPKPNWSFYGTMVGAAVEFGLLYAGGLFA